MTHLKNHRLFIAAFSATIFIFLYPLIFMRSSFLYGDSFVQFYPWFKCYSEAIKSFSFPYWIKAMGSGFPLMAEGQIGGFYPLNVILFFALPFKIAYNYSIVLHFIMGGVFTYLYTRKLGADEMGGYIAALLFCFGSAYSGCFYNMITLRTLAWFPFVLLLFEYYFNSRRPKYIIFSGIILGFQFLAGFIQMAAYSALFYLAYLFYRSLAEKIDVKKIINTALVFSVSSFVIAVPQLILTYQLSSFSNRENATLGFALWRSFLPLDLVGVVFPFSFSSSHAHFYVGVLSLLFVVFSFFTIKKNPLLKVVILILCMSLFFAVGWFNPLYIALLKLTRFYFFRNPSKFLFFGAFALAVLTGAGFTRFFKIDNDAEKEKAISVFRIIISIAAFCFLSVKLLLLFFKDNILEFGRFLVKNFIYNKPHHRYSLDYYMNGVNATFEKVYANLSLSHIFVAASWFFVLLALVVLFALNKKRLRELCAAIIFLDIFVFSFYGIGFRSNIMPFNALTPETPNILERLKADPEIYRILPFDIKSEKLPNWSLPNANIYYGIDSIGCYTPLAGRDYRRTLSGLELVDDSLGLDAPAEGSIERDIDIIKLLNVKYIVTDKKLNKDFLEEILVDKGAVLYKLKYYFPRAFFSYDAENGIKAESVKDLKIILYKDGFLQLQIDTAKKGFIIFSENFYPGWHVYVDGREEQLIRVKGLLQGVAIDTGAHEVIFIYKPVFMVKK
jgi:hypothetical protein